MTRVLYTGARDWPDELTAFDALELALALDPNPIIVHGAAKGFDAMIDRIAKEWDLQREWYPARDFWSPRVRNQHMVNLGADLCVAAALRWDSGTGMCARMARRAGIDVRDLGVSTA